MWEPLTNHETTQEIDPLLRQAINNDREALEELFSRHRNRLYRTAYHLTRNADDAEDALQDGLLAAYLNLNKFEGRSQFSTWLTRIVVNAALMQLRRNRCLVMVSIDQPLDQCNEPLANIISDSAPNPEEACGRKELLQILMRALQELRPIYRDALWLCDFQGLSYSEAAEIMGVPIGSFKAQLHRARRKFWKKIAEA